ncbi:MAG: PHP-associated domain-containing protein [Candidatus Limnocylindrales bacterium]
MAESPAFIDLHCHTSASFDSLAAPAAVVQAAARRGLTHLLVTDHDRIDGALRARDAAPDGLTVIVGQEVRTTSGDLIAAFLARAVPPGLPIAAAIAAIREQGGLVGVPHPFDRHRSSLGRDEGSGRGASSGPGPEDGLAALVGLVDWIEVHNARLIGSGNERAARFAHEHGLPGVAVSDAHSTLEVGVAYTALRGDPSTPDGLLAALRSPQLVLGRASYAARLITPIAKLVHRARGEGRASPT